MNEYVTAMNITLEILGVLLLMENIQFLDNFFTFKYESNEKKI